MYPGDPVTGSGDLDFSSADRRMMATTGPFDMIPGDSQYVLLRLAVGQGSDCLNSVTELREILHTEPEIFDEDEDGIPWGTDNCPTIYNPDQVDSDGNGIGDLCEPVSCCEVRGDFDHNGRVDVSDIAAWALWAFNDGSPPTCVHIPEFHPECDMDNDGRVDVADLVAWVEWSFSGGEPPVPCE